MEEEFFDRLREKVLPYFDGNREGHGFDHVERVYNLALKISEDENVDMDVIRAAVLLHDIAREKEGIGDNNVCHAEEGAKMAVGILEEVGFPKEKIDLVSHAISVHRYRKNLEAETREAEILQDADRLDSLGAVIITRMMEFVIKYNLPVYDPNVSRDDDFYGSKSTLISYIYGKLLKITPDSFKTAKGREIAHGRYDFVREFAERYVGEVEGRM